MTGSRHRIATMTNSVLERAGVRVVATDALALRLQQASAHQPVRPPAEGLADDVVLLRPLAATDVRAVAELTGGRGEAWLARQAALQDAGLGLDLAIVDRADGALRGVVQLKRIDWPNRRGSVGVWAVPGARRRGFTARGLQLLVDWVFSAGVLDRLEYVTRADNTASLRLAERCGFQEEGRLRSCLIEDRRRHDAVLLALLAEDRGQAHHGARRIRAADEEGDPAT